MPKPKGSKKWRAREKKRSEASVSSKKQTTKEIKSVLEATGLSAIEDVQDATINDPAMLEAIQELFRLSDEACSQKLRKLSRKQEKVPVEDQVNIFECSVDIQTRRPDNIGGPRPQIQISDGARRDSKQPYVPRGHNISFPSPKSAVQRLSRWS